MLAGHSRQEAKQSYTIRQSSVAGVRSSMRGSVMKGGRMAAPKGLSEMPLGMAHRVGHHISICTAASHAYQQVCNMMHFQHKPIIQDAVQVYDEEGVDRTPKQLVQRQVVPTQAPLHAALPSMLPSGENNGGSILGRQHRESRMSSRVSKLSELCLLLTPSLAITVDLAMRCKSPLMGS